MKADFEIVPHTADVGIRVRAPDLPDLFATAARAFFSLIVENLAEVHPVETVTYRLESPELDYLFLDWLNELLYTFESRHLLLSRFEVQVDGNTLTARAQGEPMDTTRHRMDHEVKAITYHGLAVRPVDGGYEAEVILDI